MKKKLLLVVAMVSLLVFILAIATSATEINGVHYTLDAKNQVATVNKDNKTAQTEIVTIPSVITYEGVEYKVTKIQDNAFDSNKIVKEIRILSEHITAIPYGMIANTYNGALVKIYIDFSNITSFAGAALNPSNQTNGNSPYVNNFYYYDAKAFLETGADVVITEPDFSNCTSIGNAAFQGANFEKVTIPASVAIGNQMFRCCTMKELVIEGENRESMSYYNFQACKQLKKITIKSRNLKSIANDNFANCTAVEEIYIDLSKCQEVGSCAFTFASSYDSGQTRVQWYNLEGEKIVDLSSMQNFKDRCFSSANIGSAKIIWPKAIKLLEDQAFRKCNINQPMMINAAEGVTLKLHYWAFNGNSPTILLCNAGVTETAARFTGTTAVFLAPSLNITDSGRGFNGASTLYTFGLTSGSYVPKESEATVINISAGNIYNYGACGIVGEVTVGGEKVTVGKVAHTTVDNIDNSLCPVGKVTVTSCKFCEYAAYSIDGVATERKEHEYTLVGSIVYADYFQMGFKTTKCQCSAEMAADTATEAPLFVSIGYSVSTFADKNGNFAITQGFGINLDAVNAYLECVPDFAFGVVATVGNNNPISVLDGEIAYDANVICAPISRVVDGKVVVAHDYFEIKVSGIPGPDTDKGDKRDVPVVFNGYVVDGGEVYYLSGNTTYESAQGITYNQAVELSK